MPRVTREPSRRASWSERARARHRPPGAGSRPRRLDWRERPPRPRRRSTLASACSWRPCRGDTRRRDSTHDDRSQPVERAPENGRDAEGGVAHRQREQDEESRQYETEPTQQPAPPSAARVAQKDAELRRGRAGQHVDERDSFDESLLGNPLALFLKLDLHDAHDGGTPVGRGPDLQELTHDVLPVFDDLASTHAGSYFTKTHVGWSSGNAISPITAAAAMSRGLLTFQRNSTTRLTSVTTAVSQSPMAIRPRRTQAPRIVPIAAPYAPLMKPCTLRFV